MNEEQVGLDKKKEEKEEKDMFHLEQEKDEGGEKMKNGQKEIFLLVQKTGLSLAPCMTVSKGGKDTHQDDCIREFEVRRMSIFAPGWLNKLEICMPGYSCYLGCVSWVGWVGLLQVLELYSGIETFED